MGNILKMEKKQQIQAFVALGWSDRAIQRETGIDRGTVAKYREGQNPPKVLTDKNVPIVQNSAEVPTDLVVKLPPTNSARIRPFVEIVRKSFLKRLTAQRIYQDLVEQHDYKGSYDSVKLYVRKLRKRNRRYRERLPHLPGREAQVDFGKTTCLIKINGQYRKRWLFKMTLSCSKHAYEELVERQDMETFLLCHEHAFAFFGGVPEIVTLDNIKAAVLLASIYDPIMNRTYLSFATHWGFAANPCMPYRPEHKGVVERDIGYTKHNALDGRRFDSLDEGNAILRHWNKRWARTRIHGTTKCQVWKLFCELERPVLRPLVEKPFEYFHPGVRKVDVSGLVEVKSSFYAAPPKFVDKTIIVHFNQKWVKIFDKNELLITHRRILRKGKVSMPLSCKPSWKHPSLESQELYYCGKARAVGPNMHALVYAILYNTETDPLAIRRVRGLLSLVKTYGSPTVEEAAAHARHAAVRNYHFVKNVCEQIEDVKEPNAPITQHHDLIRPLGEYDTVVTERSLSCQ